VTLTYEEELKIRVAAVMSDLGNVKHEASCEVAVAVKDKLNMKARINTLKNELAGALLTLEEVLEEQASLEEELTSLLKALSEMNGRHTQAKLDVINMKGTISSSKREQAEVQKQVGALYAETQEIDKKRAMVFKDLFNYRQKLSCLTVEQAAAQTELTTYSKEKEKQVAKVEALTMSIQWLQRKAEETQLDRQDASAKVAELTKTKINLETEIGQLDHDRCHMREQCGVITHDINSKKGKIGKLSQDYRATLFNTTKIKDQNKFCTRSSRGRRLFGASLKHKRQEGRCTRG